MTEYIKIPKKDHTVRILAYMAVLAIFTPLVLAIRTANNIVVSHDAFVAGFIAQALGTICLISLLESEVKLTDEYYQTYELQTTHNKKVKP